MKYQFRVVDVFTQTQVYGINRHAEIAGLYFVGARTIHGFIRTP